MSIGFGSEYELGPHLRVGLEALPGECENFVLTGGEGVLVSHCHRFSGDAMS